MVENNATLVPFVNRTRREKQKSPIGTRRKGGCINVYDNISRGIITSFSKKPTALIRYARVKERVPVHNSQNNGSS